MTIGKLTRGYIFVPPPTVSDYPPPETVDVKDLKPEITRAQDTRLKPEIKKITGVCR